MVNTNPEKIMNRILGNAMQTTARKRPVRRRMRQEENIYYVLGDYININESSMLQKYKNRLNKFNINIIRAASFTINSIGEGEYGSDGTTPEDKYVFIIFSSNENLTKNRIHNIVVKDGERPHELPIINKITYATAKRAETMSNKELKNEFVWF